MKCLTTEREIETVSDFPEIDANAKTQNDNALNDREACDKDRTCTTDLPECDIMCSLW